MKALCCGIVSLLLMVSASAQDPHNVSGTPNTGHSQPEGAPSAVTQPAKANADQLQHDAAELMALTKSVPTDIDALNRGLLPKEMIEKLKRIEKLSKELRKKLSH